jgi:3D (Asp-Asp-Asp) domain-containing protein
VHRETGLWSGPDDAAQLFGLARVDDRFQVARPQDGPRLLVWDPVSKNYCWIDASAVGPSEKPSASKKPKAEDPTASKERETAPDRALIWSGQALVTMYSCVELGGCSRTAIGIWPYEGVVAVDPRVIPLGSAVWVEGLGMFLAADTGSRVPGGHNHVCVQD